ncbi:MAG: hypothetical protein LQ351_003849 [Letrouitia transgressa]|nr:MAG: hypothetical protein LQ351_003849 [Letrouitia transgressa]
MRTQAEFFELQAALWNERRTRERLEEELAEGFELRAALRNEGRTRERLEQELAALKEENARLRKAQEAKKTNFNPAAASFQPSPPPAAPPLIPKVAWRTREQEMQSFVKLFPQHGKKAGE